ncbi:MAG: hypothetical protein VYB30_01415 [Candidatus Thermoplasmatota archaeon]|nr:hypothetical protein [Candidatus Thermoplasmatota archaeon]
MGTTIVSFSSSKEFAGELDRLMQDSGYSNRSRFLRDAAIRYAELMRLGDISDMDDQLEVDGTLVVYYQHEAGKDLEKYRHMSGIHIHSYHHSCLRASHTCVDTIQLNGRVGEIREMTSELKQTTDVDRVEFLVSPQREKGCC